MLSHSLGRQLFVFITGLTLLILLLLALLLLPFLEQRVLEREQQISEQQLNQARLILDFGSEFSLALDQLVLDYHRQELGEYLRPLQLLARQQEAKLLPDRSNKQQLLDELIEWLKQQSHQQGKHLWLSSGNGDWLYHPHGDPTNLAKQHRERFLEFVEQIKVEGSAAAQLPWLESYMLDTKPVIAHYLPQLDVIVGLDSNVTSLSNSPAQSYYKLRKTLRAILEGAAFGEYGQLFFFFADLDFLSNHSSDVMFNVLSTRHNPLTGNTYVEDFQAAAHNQKPISLLWNREDDLDSFTYQATARAFYYPAREIYMVSIVYPEDLQKQSRFIRSSVLTVLVVCLFAALLGAWWLSRRIVKPVRTLSDYAQKVAGGKLDLRSEMDRKDELGILSRELDSMVEQLEQTISGLDRQVLQRTEALNLQNQQLQLSLKDREALLREVHHRVKNNLAVIIGFIQLTQRRHHDPHLHQVLTALRGRVYTVELIHHLLYQTENFSDICPKEYYRSLVQEIWQLYSPPSNIRYQLNVEVEQQPLEQLLACGQLLNELLSNCLKYAFSEGHEGLVTIDIQHSGKGKDIELLFADNGRGLDEDSQQLPERGLGFTLLQHLVNNKLRGDLNWQSGSEGLSWQVRFPVSAFGENNVPEAEVPTVEMQH